MLSETIAYTELDLENGRPLTAGGLWEHYEEYCRQWSESFHQAASHYIPRVVAPEYQDICLNYFDLSAMQNMRGDTRKFCYRRKVGADFHWVELSIHVFCERFTGHHYALLYLKDIDTDKKRELAQVSAANTDPLTRVYNRRMFRDEVETFMERTDKPACGALILFDIDDFKQINDSYGHVQGDLCLAEIAECIKKAYANFGYCYRIGGDEFCVLLKSAEKEDWCKQEFLHQLEEKRRKITFLPTVSYGSASFSCGDIAAVKNKADQDMYQYKKGRKKHGSSGVLSEQQKYQN